MPPDSPRYPLREGVLLFLRLGCTAFGGRAALVDRRRLALAAVSCAFLLGTRLNLTWILLGAGVMGWLARGV